jgi:hypothetical protein
MGAGGMKSSLASRLGDIPGVASVAIDLEGFGRGIDVRLEPGADEVAVMEKLRALLAAYGVRHETQPEVNLGRARRPDPGVDVIIEPLKTGARIEVVRRSVKSFRIVAANPISVAQGLADAWCQVVGRIPLEITTVEIDDENRLAITAFDGEHHVTGRGDVRGGWVDALIGAIGEVLGDAGAPDIERAAS